MTDVIERPTLFRWQQDALDTVKDQARIALFMQMRLGKTRVSIRWAQGRAPRGRILILAPLAPISPDWVDELKSEGIGRASVYNLTLMTEKLRLEYAFGGPGWYLLNYEGARATPAVLRLPWDVVIADESTALKNPQAQITKLILASTKHIPNRAILSGDPRPENDLNYFTQFKFLYGNFMGFDNYWVFRNAKFQQSKFVEWDWQPKPGVRDEIKQWVHSRAVIQTRKQYKVGGTKVYNRRVVEMNPAQKRAYKKVFRDYEFEYIKTNFATVRDIWLARIAGGFSPDQENPEVLSNNKTNEIVDLLKGELKKEQVVVWFRFNEELQHVLRTLRSSNIDATGMWGATPKVDRIRMRRQFKSGRYQALCVQVKLAYRGIDLSSASTSIYYSNPYDLESRSQSEDRIVHPTKTGLLHLIDINTRGSIDEEISLLLRDKRRNSTAFMRRLNAIVWAEYWRLRGAHPKEKEERLKEEKARVQIPFRIFPASAHAR